jgi:hypothetical protein
MKTKVAKALEGELLPRGEPLAASPWAGGRPRKGEPRRGGRKKGTVNKVTREVKEMVLEALDKAGGVKYLTRQAHTNPRAFLALLSRIIPLQVKMQGEVNQTYTLDPTKLSNETLTELLRVRRITSDRG